MASLRASSKCLARHLRLDRLSVQGLSRSLSSFPLSSSSSREFVTFSLSQPQGIDESVDLAHRIGEINLGAFTYGRKNFSTSASESQPPSESEVPAPQPAAGYSAVSSPLRSYSPVLSGFSVLPHPAAGLPAGLSPPSNVGSLSLEFLGREMSNLLSLGKLEETIRLFEEWVKSPGLDGKPKVPNLMVYNLLLHAKLRIGADPRNLLQVLKEMEMSGINPNLLTFNFLLRAIFRHRDSIMAEKIIARMEQRGPEAQPDGDSYNFVIVLCALDRRLDAGLKHLQSMYNRGYVPSKTTYNELLLTATRLHRTRVAVSLLKDLKKYNVAPQVQSIAELAVAATEVDDSECALLALRVLSESELSKSVRNLTMDEGGIHAILSCAARAADIELSTEAWSMLRASFRGTKTPRPSSYHARIHALAAGGDFDTAFSTLHEMQEAYNDTEYAADTNIFSPFTSLRPLVLACTRGGAAALDAAYYKLAEMHAAGKPVALAAINCVIQGCSNIWDYDRAYQTFEAIGTTFGLMPDVHSCNALLDVFGKNRKTSEVLQIYSYMGEMGIRPDSRTYSLIIEAHVVNRDVKAAMESLDALVNAGHTPARDTMSKIQRRCVKEGDENGAREIDRLLKKMGYRDGGLKATKWQQILLVL
ncbi:protein MpPPR_7 [Marchantia polymorpha subsp. ruderalis]|uniref:Pentatricopeptide repeat-containing protein-mitochondrial domain-containing protein n=2 Tax=Marchantia polymorpha TaxID=3197 RepID=A0AAF6AU79_MARPO|nr:hypothetical protein MARPO_0002s0313 [Marchantia polymorpha]BBM99999.1 hypothetical protein Mp_1g25580 [Marchantia polymorpha subsp. ruderalis]|eukprot:PTQ49878.1 hypothetical protein MARPO_0002s0313 [Marchantia polymorpha]